MEKKFRSGVLISIIMVILGLSAVGCFVWHTGKMFVGLVSSETTATSENPSKTSSEILNLPEIKLWTCQIGVYKDKKNAEALLQNLHNKGCQAVIISKEPYQVAVGAFGSDEEALSYYQGLLENGIDSWVREVTYPALHYKVSGSETETVLKILELANSLCTNLGQDYDRTNAADRIRNVINSDYPEGFRHLQDDLSTLNASLDSQGNSQYKYNQQLLQVFAEYKWVTYKYFEQNP